jgi:hypothetical protein
MMIPGIFAQWDKNHNLQCARIINLGEFVSEFGNISLNEWKKRFWPIFQNALIEKRKTELLVEIAKKRIGEFV